MTSKEGDSQDKDNERSQCFQRIARPVPDGRLLRRVAQIGGGIIFGSFEFVSGEAMRHGACFKARHVGPKAVFSGEERGLSPFSLSPFSSDIIPYWTRPGAALSG